MMHTDSRRTSKDMPGDDAGEAKPYLEEVEKTQDADLGQMMEVAATPEEERRVVWKLDMMWVMLPISRTLLG
jgi:hypothetical protein